MSFSGLVGVGSVGFTTSIVGIAGVGVVFLSSVLVVGVSSLTITPSSVLVSVVLKPLSSIFSTKSSKLDTSLRFIVLDDVVSVLSFSSSMLGSLIVDVTAETIGSVVSMFVLAVLLLPQAVSDNRAAKQRMIDTIFFIIKIPFISVFGLDFLSLH